MKNLTWRLSLMAAFAALAWSGSVAVASAADQDHGGPADRIERLEKQVNEMAQRQEQLLRRLGAQQERHVPGAMPGRDELRQPGSLPRPGMGPRREPAGAQPVPAVRPAPAAPNVCKKIAELVKLCFLVGFVFNILIAVWIFTDIRKRGEGSGIFIALALLAGIPTAIIYAIVRIGDKKA
jgi:HAMP domain-containing protein